MSQGADPLAEVDAFLRSTGFDPSVLPDLTAPNGGLASRPDVEFLVGLARGLRRSAGLERLDGNEGAWVVEQLAAGTLEALPFALGVTNEGPSSGRVLTERTFEVFDEEAWFAEQLRESLPHKGPQWYYYGGMSDALDFAAGYRLRFWWVPLPERLRAGPPARDEFAYTIR